MGRFLSIDPVIPTAAVKEPQRWNPYAYVSNNPMKNADPTGKLVEVRAGTCDDRTPCYSKLDTFEAVKNFVGDQAAKYLRLGKNGQVTLNGISAANFIRMGGGAEVVQLFRFLPEGIKLAAHADDAAHAVQAAVGLCQLLRARPPMTYSRVLVARRVLRFRRARGRGKRSSGTQLREDSSRPSRVPNRRKPTRSHFPRRIVNAMNLLIADAEQRPELFHWNGPVDRSIIEESLASYHLLPGDLIDFWAETGGGDFFESETILGPSGDDRLGDSVRIANELHRQGGMPMRYVLFRTGVGLSAIDLETGKYVELSPTYETMGSYDTFNAWYWSIRRDFAETYGLTPLPVVVGRQ